MPNPIEDLLAQLSQQGGPQAPDDSPQLAGTSLTDTPAPPATSDPINLGERPPSTNQLARDKMLADLTAKQQDMSRIDDQGRNGYQRLIAQTLGDQESYTKKKVEERFGGKLGTAKAMLIDFISGVAKHPGDIKEATKQDALTDYQKASKDVIDQEKSQRQQQIDQINLLHQNVQQEKNDDVMKHYEAVAKQAETNANNLKEYRDNKIAGDKAKLDAKTADDASKAAYRTMLSKAKEKQLDINHQKSLKSTNAIELAQKQADAKGLTVGSPEYLKDVDDTLAGLSKAHYAYKPPPSTMATAPDDSLKPAIEREAQAYNAGKPITNMGMGKEAVAFKKAILQRAAELDPSGSLAQAQAQYFGTKAGMSSIIKSQSQVEGLSKTVDKSLDIVQKRSDETHRSGMPLANRFLLWKKGQVDGDDDTALLNNAVITATTEYARVMSGTMSGQVTDSLRHEAENLLSSAMADHTVPKVIAQMRQEMNIRKNSFAEQTREMKNSIGSGTSNGAKKVPMYNPKTRTFE